MAHDQNRIGSLINLWFAALRAGRAWQPSIRPLAVAWASACLVGGILLPLSSQAEVIEDPAAAIGFRPQIVDSQTQAPVVNITAPSQGGISHNQYERYDVDAAGVILNNSRQNGQSQLGGQLNANPNLTGNSANVIVNEVTSTNPSQLNGQTEVFGDRANVIIANPNGVNCDGCGFINTDRATLTTGVPSYDANGQLDLQIRQGEVNVQRNGLQGNDTHRVDLLGRQVTIDGDIDAQDRLDVGAGAQNYHYSQSQDGRNLKDSTTPINDAANNPATSIDGSVFGAMRAGQVQVLSTDQGVGVRNHGSMSATADSLFIDVEGDLDIRGTDAQQDIRINAAGNITQNGDSSAGRDIHIQANDLWVAPDRVINANRDVDIQTTNNASVMGTTRASRNLTVRTGNDANIGGSNTAQTIDIQTDGNLSASEGTLIADEVKLNASGNLSLESLLVNAPVAELNGANVNLGPNTTLNFSGSPITINASGDFTNATQLNAPNINLLIEGNITNTQTGRLQAEQLLIITPETLTNDGDLIGTQATTIQAAELNNSGMLYGELQLSLNVAGNTNNRETGELVAEQLTLNSQGDVTNAGQIIGFAQTTIQAGSLTNTGGTVYGEQLLSIQTDGDLSNQAQGAIMATQQLVLDAGGAMQNTAGTIQADSIAITAAQTLLNDNGLIYTPGTLTINAQGLDNRYTATELATQNLGIQVDTLTLNLSDAAQGGTGLSNSSLISLNTAFNYTAQAAFNNNQGQLQAQRITIDNGQQASSNDLGLLFGFTGIDITSGTLSNDQGVIRSNQALNITLSDTLTTSGQLIAPDNIQITAANAITNTGRIDSGQSIQIIANSLQNNSNDDPQSGIVLANQAITIQANTSNSGALIAGADSQITGTLDNTGLIQMLANRDPDQGGDVNAASLSFTQIGRTLINRLDGLITADNLQFDLSNNAANSNAINSNAASSNTIDNQGRLLASQTLTINSAGHVYNQGILDATDITLNLAGQTLTNEQGLMTARNQLQLNAADLINQADVTATPDGVIAGILAPNLLLNVTRSLDNRSLISTASDLTLTGLERINNDQGQLRAGNINLSATAISNAAGLINAQGDLNLTAQQLNNASDTFTIGSRLNATGAITLSSQSDLHNDGDITAGTSITINTAAQNLIQDLIKKDLINQGLISAQNVTISSQNIINQTIDNRPADSTQQTGVLGATQQLQLTANEHISNQGNLISNGTATLIANQLDNQGLLQVWDTTNPDLSTNQLTLNLAELTNQRDGTILAGQLTAEQNAAVLNNIGQISAATTAAISNFSALNNQGRLQATVLNVQGTTFSNQVDSHADAVDDAGVIRAGQLATLDVQSLQQQTTAAIESEGLLHLTVGSDYTHQGHLTAGDCGAIGVVCFNLNVAGQLNNQGNITTARNGIISAQGINNLAQARIESHGDLLLETLNANQDFIHANDAVLETAGSLSIASARDADIAGSILAEGTLDITATRTVYNTRNTDTQSGDDTGLFGRNVFVTAQHYRSRSGNVMSDFGRLQATDSDLYDTQGGIAALTIADDYTLTADDQRIVGDRIVLTTTGHFLNDGGAWEPSQHLQITAASITNGHAGDEGSTQSYLYSQGSVYLEATDGDVTNHGEILSREAMGIKASQDITNTNLIVAGGDLNLTATGTLLNDQATILGFGNARIEADQLDNFVTTIDIANDLIIEANTVQNRARIDEVVGGAFQLDGFHQIRNRTQYSTSDIFDDKTSEITVTGLLSGIDQEVTAAVIRAGRDLTINADDTINDNSIITANNDLRIIGDNFKNIAYAVRADYTYNVGYDFNGANAEDSDKTSLATTAPDEQCDGTTNDYYCGYDYVAHDVMSIYVREMVNVDVYSDWMYHADGSAVDLTSDNSIYQRNDRYAYSDPSYSSWEVTNERRGSAFFFRTDERSRPNSLYSSQGHRLNHRHIHDNAANSYVYRENANWMFNADTGEIALFDWSEHGTPITRVYTIANDASEITYRSSNIESQGSADSLVQAGGNITIVQSNHVANRGNIRGDNVTVRVRGVEEDHGQEETAVTIADSEALTRVADYAAAVQTQYATVASQLNDNINGAFQGSNLNAASAIDLPGEQTIADIELGDRDGPRASHFASQADPTAPGGIINGITDPTVRTPDVQRPDAVINLVDYYNPLNSPSLFEGRSGAFFADIDVPGSGFDLTPDYLLDAVGAVTDPNLRFFADPFIEAQLLRQAALNQAGASYFDKDADTDAAQRQQLYDNAIAFAQQQGLVLGQSLTAAQQAALSDSILWYQEQEINGETQLVPVLYLSQADQAALEYQPGGSIEGNTVVLDTDQDLHNTGNINANGLLSVTAKNILNEQRVVAGWGQNGTQSSFQNGGNMSGALVNIVAIEDFTNRGGDINADYHLGINAGGDLNIESANYTDENRWRSGRTSYHTITTRHELGTLNSGGSMSLTANNDLNIIGGQLAADGSISLYAGGDTTVESVHDRDYFYSKYVKKRSFGRKKVKVTESDQETVLASSIVAGDNLLINAAINPDGSISRIGVEGDTDGSGNVTINGADLSAQNELIIASDGAVDVVATQYTDYAYSFTKKKGFGGFSGRQSQSVDQTYHLRNASLNAENGNVTVLAGEGITVVAGDINSTNANVNLIAEGDVIVSAGDVLSHSESMSSKTSIGNLLKGELLKMRSTTEGEWDKSAQASNITAGGSFNIKGRTGTIIGSDITTGTGITANTTEGGLRILGAEEQHYEYSKTVEASVSLNPLMLVDPLFAATDALEFDYESAKEGTTTTNYAGSTLITAGSMNFTSADGIEVTGSTLMAGTDSADSIRFTAENGVVINNGLHSETESLDRLSISGTMGLVESEFSYSSEHLDSTTQSNAMSQIISSGNIIIDSGTADVVGSYLGAGGNVLAQTDSGDITVAAAQLTNSSSHSTRDINVQMGGVPDIKSEDGEILIQLGSASYNATETNTQSTRHEGSLVAANEHVVFNSAGHINIAGSTIVANADRFQIPTDGLPTAPDAFSNSVAPDAPGAATHTGNADNLGEYAQAVDGDALASTVNAAATMDTTRWQPGQPLSGLAEQMQNYAQQQRQQHAYAGYRHEQAQAAISTDMNADMNNRAEDPADGIASHNDRAAQLATPSYRNQASSEPFTSNVLSASLQALHERSSRAHQPTHQPISSISDTAITAASAGASTILAVDRANRAAAAGITNGQTTDVPEHLAGRTHAMNAASETTEPAPGDNIGDIVLISQGDVNILDVTDSQTVQQEITTGSGEINFVIQHQSVQLIKAIQAADAAKDAAEAAEDNYDDQKDQVNDLEQQLSAFNEQFEAAQAADELSAQQRLGMLQQQQLLEQQLSAAEDDLDWANKNRIVAAAQATQAGINLVNEIRGTATSVSTYGFDFGVQLALEAQTTDTTTTTGTSVGSSVMGQNVSILTGVPADVTDFSNITKDDIDANSRTTISGSHVNAINNASLTTGALDVLASTDTLDQRIDSESGALEVEITIHTGFSASASYDQSRTRNTSTTYNASSINGNTIDLNTVGDATFVGSSANAIQSLTTDIGGDLSLLAVQNTNSSDSDGWGVSLGIGNNASVSLGAHTFDNHSDDNRTVMASLNGGQNLNLGVDGNLDLLGSTAGANNINATIGGDLTIASLQDTSDVNNQSLGINFSTDGRGGHSTQLNASQTTVDYDAVTSQAGLYATDTATIDVTGHTHLDAGVIHVDNADQPRIDADGNETAALNFSTGSLSYQHQTNQQDISSQSFSVGYSVAGDPNAEQDSLLNLRDTELGHAIAGAPMQTQHASQYSKDDDSREAEEARLQQQRDDLLNPRITTDGLTLSVGTPYESNQSSTTYAGISAGNITIRNDADSASENGTEDATDLSDLRRDTDNISGVLAYTYNQAAIDAQTQALSGATALTYQGVGELANDLFHEADSEAGREAWNESGVGRAALHAVAGALLSQAAGGDATSGAAAAGGNVILNDLVVDALADSGLIETDKKGNPVGNIDNVREIIGMGIGAATAAISNGNSQQALANANLVQTAEQNNRQLHEHEIKLIEENAEDFYQHLLQLAADGDITLEDDFTLNDATNLLARQRQREVDANWEITFAARGQGDVGLGNIASNYYAARSNEAGYSTAVTEAERQDWGMNSHAVMTSRNQLSFYANNLITTENVYRLMAQDSALQSFYGNTTAAQALANLAYGADFKVGDPDLILNVYNHTTHDEFVKLSNDMGMRGEADANAMLGVQVIKENKRNMEANGLAHGSYDVTRMPAIDAPDPDEPRFAYNFTMGNPEDQGAVLRNSQAQRMIANAADPDGDRGIFASDGVRAAMGYHDVDAQTEEHRYNALITLVTGSDEVDSNDLLGGDLDADWVDVLLSYGYAIPDIVMQGKGGSPYPQTLVGDAYSHADTSELVDVMGLGNPEHANGLGLHSSNGQSFYTVFYGNDDLSYADTVAATTGIVGGYTSEETFTNYANNLNRMQSGQTDQIDLSLEAYESGINYQHYLDSSSVFDSPEVRNQVKENAADGPIGNIIQGVNNEDVLQVLEGVAQIDGDFVVHTDDQGNLIQLESRPDLIVEILAGVSVGAYNVEDMVNTQLADNVPYTQDVEITNAGIVDGALLGFDIVTAGVGGAMTSTVRRAGTQALQSTVKVVDGVIDDALPATTASRPVANTIPDLPGDATVRQVFEVDSAGNVTPVWIVEGMADGPMVVRLNDGVNPPNALTATDDLPMLPAAEDGVPVGLPVVVTPGSGVVPEGDIAPGQVASPYPQNRPVAGNREGARPTDPPRGMQESGAWELTPDNLARMERGQAPIGNDGKPIELHHQNQNPAGPLDELTNTTHRGVDHPISPSQIDRNQFAGERRRYWVERSRELLGQGQNQAP